MNEQPVSLLLTVPALAIRFNIAHRAIFILRRVAPSATIVIFRRGYAGVSSTGVKCGVLQLGDTTYIGANAICAGPVTACSNPVIAACSLVISHVQEGAVMMGVPASVDS